MATVRFDPDFEKLYRRIKHAGLKKCMRTQIEKILARPQAGKPMRHQRRGTRELYVSPYRISYLWLKEENTIVFLTLYHKDEQ